MPDEARPADAPPTHDRRPLDGEELHTALAALPGWEAEGQRLVRTVPTDQADFDELEYFVTAEVREAGGAVSVERTDEAIRFLLPGDGADAVSPHDVELAGRIDRALAAGGGRRAG